MKLENQIREVMRFRHYSSRTEESYVGWCRQFVKFHELRHPGEMGAAGNGVRVQILTKSAAFLAFQHATKPAS
jgi:hypothetical protein